MSTISLAYATNQDAVALAQISQRAFASDLLCGAPGMAVRRAMIAPHGRRRPCNWLLISARLVEGKLAGGAIVYAQGQGRYYLGRVFLDPAMHRQGIGLAVMQLKCCAFPRCLPVDAGDTALEHTDKKFLSATRLSDRERDRGGSVSSKK